MRYFGKYDAYYTAAGIAILVGFLVLYSVLSSFGWVGWVLNIAMICGGGMILGEFLHNWHVDFKFEKELDGFEEHLREALHLKNKDTIQ